MRGYFLVLFLLCSVSGLVAEEEQYSVGALPPIGESLNAPIQIDESNTHAQTLYMTEAAERLEEHLNAKKFPIEIILMGIAIWVGYYVMTHVRPTAKVDVKPALTQEERLLLAQKILTEASDELSDEEALALFALLDPMAESLPDPKKYESIAEQVKFAGERLKKQEFDQILITG